MDPLNQLSSTLALSMGSAWASGINLYAAVFMLGTMGATGNMTLPPELAILASPLVITASGIMYVVEFVADKIPGIDTGWDTIHTFIRIPAGAMLAAAAVGDINQPMAIAAGLMGGGLAAGSHAGKAGTRVMINTSPEPFTNWFTSVGEDVAVVAGIWAAVAHPQLFLVFLVLFVLSLVWLLPKVWRGVKKVFSCIGRLFGGQPTEISHKHHTR